MEKTEKFEGICKKCDATGIVFEHPGTKDDTTITCPDCNGSGIEPVQSLTATEKAELSREDQIDYDNMILGNAHEYANRFDWDEPEERQNAIDSFIAGFNAKSISTPPKSLQAIKDEGIKLPSEDELFQMAADGGLRDWEQQLWWEGATRVRKLVLDQYASSLSATGENDGWISVEDKLPEIGTEVNVFTVNGKVTSLCRLIRYEGATNYYWDNNNGHGNIYLKEAVTHWMPLPSAPKQ